MDSLAINNCLSNDTQSDVATATNTNIVNIVLHTIHIRTHASAQTIAPPPHIIYIQNIQLAAVLISNLVILISNFVFTYISYYLELACLENGIPSAETSTRS